MTNFSDVYKFFLNGISNDYRLKNLIMQDIELAEDMFEYWLYKAILIFQDNTSEDLESFVDRTNKVLNKDLTISQLVLLGQTMVLVWLEWNINDITQMNNTLTDNDFKHYSEERNLNAKSEYADRVREKLYHEYQLYCLKQFNPASDWSWMA